MAGVLFLLLSHLLHFAQFVAWPERALPPGAPIVIGIIGEDPFGPTLDGVAAGRRANGHPFVVRRLQWNDVLTSCHMIYISASETDHVDAILAATRGSSILTVACADRFAARGGMIQLLPVQDGLDFDINTEAAAEAHLEISSKLLRIARALRSTVEAP